jgi:hypothetical protein
MDSKVQIQNQMDSVRFLAPSSPNSTKRGLAQGQ